jgi:CRISPR/Cas system-associated exonuclease Cas4 (RecB family)
VCADTKGFTINDRTEIQNVYTLIANVFNSFRKPTRGKLMTEVDSYPSGSISKIISGILNNVPADTDRHHIQRKLGHAHQAGKCSRQIWFMCNTAKEDQHPIPVMVMGKAIHDWLSNVVLHNNDYGITTDDVADFRPRYNLIGKVDFLSPNSVGELKTTKQYAFKYLDAPREDHVLQSSIYAKFFGKRYIEIIYLARDTGNFKCFFWPALNNIDTEIERISEISQMHNPPRKITWDGQPLLPFTSEKTPWQCKYCAFRKECLETDNMGVLA